ncbi:hypothetical protein LCGC14_1404920 [marine sediment metagenome]|uniref:HNH nuclease domain-containing protein n=1 Tax=marine sediment metagenome TaxID=412755 RepID=A0A0F9JVY3_9ZZZZ
MVKRGPKRGYEQTKEHAAKSVVARLGKSFTWFDDEEFFQGATKRKSHNLVRRYARLIPQNRCRGCGVTDEWNGEKLVLHLDHINGNRDDNRLENLRWLCPNCHSQTPTYCGRNGRGFTGYSHSPETRKKIGDLNRGRKHTLEARKKMSVAAKKRYS